MKIKFRKGSLGKLIGVRNLWPTGSIWIFLRWFTIQMKDSAMSKWASAEDKNKYIIQRLTKAEAYLKAIVEDPLSFEDYCKLMNKVKTFLKET